MNNEQPNLKTPRLAYTAGEFFVCGRAFVCVNGAIEV